MPVYSSFIIKFTLLSAGIFKSMLASKYCRASKRYFCFLLLRVKDSLSALYMLIRSVNFVNRQLTLILLLVIVFI